MIMASSSKALIEGNHAAFACGDVETFQNGLASNIVWNQAENFSYADRNTDQGIAQVIEGVLHRTAEDWDEFSN